MEIGRAGAILLRCQFVERGLQRRRPLQSDHDVREDEVIIQRAAIFRTRQRGSVIAN
jgi:hypothetical protein